MAVALDAASATIDANSLETHLFPPVVAREIRDGRVIIHLRAESARARRNLTETLTGGLPPESASWPEDEKERVRLERAATLSAEYVRRWDENIRRFGVLGKYKHEADEARARPRSLGRKGGQAGRGGTKRPHTELIRRARKRLTTLGGACSPTTVMNLLARENEWRFLVFEDGDPLNEIVRVEVDDKDGGEHFLYIEYTQAYAERHRGKRIVEISTTALKRNLQRHET